MPEYVALRLLIGELGELPDGVRKELRVAFRDAGKIILDKARSNASWSSRIPGAITMRVQLSGNAGVTLRVNSKRAPHARPYEGFAGNATFRHPMFGSEPWVTQATRPFLRPARQDSGDKVVQLCRDAIDRAAHSGGFH